MHHQKLGGWDKKSGNRKCQSVPREQENQAKHRNYQKPETFWVFSSSSLSFSSFSPACVYIKNHVKLCTSIVIAHTLLFWNIVINCWSKKRKEKSNFFEKPVVTRCYILCRYILHYMYATHDMYCLMPSCLQRGTGRDWGPRRWGKGEVPNHAQYTVGITPRMTLHSDG